MLKYIIKFNTENFESKNRTSWEKQLYNDFVVKLNGKEFVCHSKEEAIKRLEFIAGRKNSFPKEDPITLKNKKYGEKSMPLQMPGVAQGYVDLEASLKKAEENWVYRIPFNNFYDLRQKAFFENCFVEIIVQPALKNQSIN